MTVSKLDVVVVGGWKFPHSTYQYQTIPFFGSAGFCPLSFESEVESTLKLETGRPQDLHEKGIVQDVPCRLYLCQIVEFLKRFFADETWTENFCILYLFFRTLDICHDVNTWMLPLNLRYCCRHCHRNFFPWAKDYWVKD